MSELAIITPSRGRPHNITALLGTLAATTRGPWRLWLGVDDDDPELDGYLTQFVDHSHVTVVMGRRQGLTGWTNKLATMALEAGAEWLASLGDDHRPRTNGWDQQLTAAIRDMPGPGFAYGNDLLQGERIPTAWVQHADTVRALGWMALPTADHLCIDVVIRDLGRAADRIRYLPHVVVEHMHPAIGKAPEDDTYRAGNSPQRVAEDGAAYQTWLRDQLQHDAATIRALTWHANVAT